jgi:hypothetical protein
MVFTCLVFIRLAYTSADGGAMTGEWRIIDKYETIDSVVQRAINWNTTDPRYKYTVEHSSTGETKRLIAENAAVLGHRIGRGEFEEISARKRKLPRPWKASGQSFGGGNSIDWREHCIYTVLALIVAVGSVPFLEYIRTSDLSTPTKFAITLLCAAPIIAACCYLLVVLFWVAIFAFLIFIPLALVVAILSAAFG